MKINRILIISVIIFGLSLLIRTNNLKNALIFVGDQEYQATYAMTIVKDFHPIWIGVSAAHTGFYLGPLFTYFTAFWLFFSRGDPLITGYVAAFIGSVVSLLIYIFIYDISKNHSVALISSIVYTFSPLIIFYDRVYWNPTPLPFLSICLLYFLYKALKGNKVFWFLFSIAFALILHTHLSILPLGFLGLFHAIKNRKAIGFKYLLLSIIGFLVLYSPLMIFDINHNWSNLKTPFRYKQIVDESTSRINLNYHINSLVETLGRFWFLNIGMNESDEVLFDCGQKTVYGRSSDILKYSDRTHPPWYMSLPVILLIFLFIVNKKTYTDPGRNIILQFFSIIIISFLLFPGGAYEFYLLGAFPLLAAMIGYSTDMKDKRMKVIICILLGIISVRGIYVVIKAKTDYGLKAKKDLISKTVSVLKDGSFQIFQSGRCHSFEGFRYLYKIYGRVPFRSSSDINFGWLYPNEITQGPVDFKVIIHERRIPYKSTEDPYSRVDEGGFTSLIYKF